MRQLYLISILLCALFATAQTGTRIEILHANALEYDDALAPGAQRLVGNVRLRHQHAIMSCDSAWLYENQTMLAFGRVHLRQGDTLDIRGDRLAYDGAKRIAVITGNVRLNDPTVTLTTDALNYDLNGKTAYYTNGGTLVSKKERNTLTSKRGQYNTGFKEFIFSDSVRLTHPERTIISDTLKYRTGTGRTIFAGPTTIDQGASTIFCTSGWYDTRTDRSELNDGARILFKDQELTGDTIRYDKHTGLGKAWGNVTMKDTVNDLFVSGNHGVFNELTDESFVTGQAMLVMAMGEDSLYMHADTLLAVNDSSGARVLHAYYGVRFFRSDMQGVCDSLVYPMADSLIQFWKDPYLWNEEEQLSGDTIQLRMRNSRPHRLKIIGSAFMMSRVDSSRFDQISGTDMIGYFNADELVRIAASGNCRTVYFAVEEQPDSTQRIMGVNRADCSRINVNVKDRSVNRITFITQPTATMYPLSKAPVDQLDLEGAYWNYAVRPLSKADIFRKTVQLP